jgi:hypothetical protein
MSEVSLLHDKAQRYTNVCNTVNIIKLGWTIIPLLPYSHDLALSDYNLFGPFKIRPVRRA